MSEPTPPPAPGAGAPSGRPLAHVVAPYDALSWALERVNVEAVGDASPLAGLTGPAASGDEGAEPAGAAEEPGPPEPLELARFQIALGQALDALEEERTDPGVLHTAQNPLASMMQTLLAERAAQTGDLREAAGGALEARFDERDLLGWFRSLFDWWRRLKPARFLAPPAAPDPLGPDVRLATFGDWGTGLYGAPEITRTLEGLPPHRRPGVVVHLGDVYYSGAPGEMAARFLDVWPRVQGAVSRGCNANHEMYSGGVPYFKKVLPAFGQSSSCWAFQNDHWLLVGLDSAYSDHDLHGDQAQWLSGLVDRAGDRRLILFSHHQPYSILEKQGPKLVNRLAALLAARRIFAWYWGHEHRCLLYDPHPAWGVLGRCLGHGGMPYFRDRGDREAGLARAGWWTAPARHGIPGGQVLGGPNPYVRGEETRYGPNGYAVLEFSGPRLLEQIALPDGTVVKETELA